MSVLSIRLPANIERKLRSEADREHLNRSTLVRRGLELLFKDNERKRALGEMVAEINSRSSRVRTELRSINEDFDALDDPLPKDEPTKGWWDGQERGVKRLLAKSRKKK